MGVRGVKIMNPGMKGVDLTIKVGGNEVTVEDASEKQCLIYLITEWSNLSPAIKENKEKIEALTKKVFYLMGGWVFIQIIFTYVLTKILK